MMHARPAAGAVVYRAVETAMRVIGGRLLARSPKSGDWLELTGALREVWEEIEYPAPADALATRLAWRYQDAQEVVEAGVRKSLAMLKDHGLVGAAPAVLDPAAAPRQRYLWLLKRALVNLLYVEHDLRLDFLMGEGRAMQGLELSRALRDIRARDPQRSQAVIDGKWAGDEPKPRSHTMVGLLRLNNLERCAEAVFRDGVPGDFMEAGVCQGGAAIFLRALQAAHGQPDRAVWLADSFQGVPPSTAAEDARYGLKLEEPHAPWLAFDLETVREHFRRYDLLGPQVRFLAGWLEDTLPAAPIGDLALLRLDVDLYSSTATALDCLYDRVSPGGFVIVDDYGALQCCRDAVDAFRARRGIATPLRWVDHSGVFWRKEAA
jgi:hypothetical protein